MLFRKDFLEGIRMGAITVEFRRWRRPSVRAGGTPLTPVGQLSIESVEPVTPNRITADDARRAGYESRDMLLEECQALREMVRVSGTPSVLVPHGNGEGHVGLTHAGDDRVCACGENEVVRIP